YALTSQTTDLCTLFANKKVYVDLFLYDVKNRNLIDASVFDNEYITVIEISYTNTLKTLYHARYINRIISSFYQPPVLYNGVVNELATIVSTIQYDYFIGIEKKGFLCASILNEKLGGAFSKIIYYSLELYHEDYGDEINAMYYGRFKQVRALEIKHYAQCDVVLIQDEQRAQVINTYNAHAHKQCIYFPIATFKTAINTASPNYFNVPEGIKTILLFGHLSRFTNELLDISTQLYANNYMLVLHGYGISKEAKNRINNEKLPVILSEKLVTQAELQTLVSHANYGLALYSNDNANNRLTAYSSNKLAIYTRVGVPIISFNNESYLHLFNQYKCGECITHISELPAIVSTMELNYATYKANSLSAYDAFFDIEKSFNTVFNQL
ncbi:MAG: hypothetical protein ABL940_13915, partial [Bacteroidia bacterium]